MAGPQPSGLRRGQAADRGAFRAGLSARGLQDTTTEPSAVILLSWANAIAHFLPANPEGIHYACGTAQAVVREMARQGRPIGFVPVIARVPDHRSEHMDADAIRAIGDTWRRWLWSDGERGYAAGLFRERDFVVLSETRELEGQERILFEMREKKDLFRQLSHDYLGLCARLAPPAECAEDPATAEAWWYGQLGMDQDARILSKQFDRYLHLGTLLNVDEQPHMAMRVKTFHLLLEGLLEACQPGGLDAQRTALVTVGRRCGRDFAAELNDTFGQEGVAASFSKRIERWAEFDSGVGIGVIHPMAIDETSGELWLRVVGDAFGLHPDWFPDAQGKDLRGFFEGYLEGVVGDLFKAVATEDDHPGLKVRAVAEDELPPGLGKDVRSEAVNYYRVSAWAKRSRSIRVAAYAGYCTGPSEPWPFVGRRIRRSVPIDWRWARGAVCILPGHFGSGISVERPKPQNPACRALASPILLDVDTT